MELEIEVAVNFLIGYLVNKLPRRRVQLFNEEVVKKLTKKFEGHWYPEKPCKGSGYRCLLITDSLDPVLSSAAEASGLSAKDVKANLPEKLCLWIDPHEVSFRIGECFLSPILDYGIVTSQLLVLGFGEYISPSFAILCYLL